MDVEEFWAVKAANAYATVSTEAALVITVISQVTLVDLHMKEKENPFLYTG